MGWREQVRESPSHTWFLLYNGLVVDTLRRLGLELSFFYQLASLPSKSSRSAKNLREVGMPVKETMLVMARMRMTGREVRVYGGAWSLEERASMSSLK